jgi:hypothetical protein
VYIGFECELSFRLFVFTLRQLVLLIWVKGIRIGRLEFFLLAGFVV